MVGTGYVGPLVGFNQGKIIDSYAARLRVLDQHYLGGLVGENSGTISSSYATGAVTSLNKITGGLVGINNGTITNSYATGSVTGNGGMIGGLVGENGGAITDSYAAGNVGGSTRQIGGLVGYNTGNGCDRRHGHQQLLGQNHERAGDQRRRYWHDHRADADARPISRRRRRPTAASTLLGTLAVSGRCTADLPIRSSRAS